ncbi:MAG: DNA methylase, partial [Deltaproteobacteria bacterium]|nr:DNA methylase [Deltaproteobacteria bacterium]
PPYYTACPNPFIRDFIEHYGKPYDPATDDYRREPFAADTSAGKFDPVYRSHSYHTKVPYIAIQEYLKHYAEGTTCVLDGFSGSGMTGIAARKLPKSRNLLHVILVDLSPEATFISSRMLNITDSSIATQEHKHILKTLVEKTARLYDVPDGHTNGQINYTVRCGCAGPYIDA